MVFHGIAHFAGSNYPIKMDIPFHHVYSMYTFKYYLFTRTPEKTSAWKNIFAIFHQYVWLMILLSLTLLGLSFLLLFKFYKNMMPYSNLITNTDRDVIEFFLKTYASITEPDPLPWFTSEAISGRILICVWILSCLILNLAFNSNLRATLLRPNSEKPVNTLQDAFERGANIWVQHLIPDASKPELIDQYIVKTFLNPAIKTYLEQHDMTTYPLSEEKIFLQDYVVKDILENGASVAYAV